MAVWDWWYRRNTLSSCLVLKAIKTFIYNIVNKIYVYKVSLYISGWIQVMCYLKADLPFALHAPFIFLRW